MRRREVAEVTVAEHRTAVVVSAEAMPEAAISVVVILAAAAAGRISAGVLTSAVRISAGTGRRYDRRPGRASGPSARSRFTAIRTARSTAGPQ